MTLRNRSNCLPYLLLSIVLLSSIAIESLHAQGVNITLPFTSDCRLSRGGHEYAGQVNVTTTGRRCQPWASSDPHYNYFTGSKNYPEGSASAARSNCRNPDEDYNEGAWCYTLDQTKRWELCNIPFCECTLSIDPLGRRYEGQIAFTRSGRRCRRWLNQNPPHPFNDTRYFPDESILEARNYCRNPNGSRPDGPWCYTVDGSSAGAWEYCLVPVCNLTAVVFPTPTIPTTTSTTRPPSTRSTTTTRRSTSRTTTFRRTTRNWVRSTITRPVATAFPLPQPVVGTESNDAAKIAVPVVIVLLAVIGSVVIAVIVLKRSNRFQSSWFRFFNRDGQEEENSKEEKTTPQDSKLESGLENPNFETIPVDDQPSPATQQSVPIKITPTGTSAWYSHNNSDQS